MSNKTEEIEKIRRLREVARRKEIEKKLSIICDLSRDLSLSLDIDKIANITVDVMRKVLEFDTSFFLLLEDKELNIVAASGFKEDVVGKKFLLDAKKGIIPWVAREGKSHLTNNTEKDDLFINIVGDFETKSEICVPLKIKDKVIGVLNAESERYNAFNEKDLKLLETLASQVAIAIENARLFKKLRESEERYRNLFENARDVIITFDLKGNVISVNKAIAEHGYRKDELIGKNMLKFVPKKYWPKLLKELAKIARGNSIEGEIEIITPKGEKISEYKSNPIRRGEKIVGFQTILRDITEQKRAEEILRKSKEKIEKLHNIATRLESLHSEEEVYELTIKTAKEILDFDRDTIFILEGDHLKIKATTEKGLSKDQRISIYRGIAGKTYRTAKSYLIEDITRDKNARPSDERVRSAISIPIGNIGVFQAESLQVNAFTEEDRKLGELLISHVAEVLKRIRFEKTLKESEEKYRTTIESAPYGIAVLDQDGNFLIANSQLEKITGYTRKEIPDLETWFEKMYPDEKYRKLVIKENKRIIPGEDPRIREAVITRKDGEKRICRFISRIFSHGLRIIFVTDITDRKLLEQQREKARKEAEFYSDLLGHDIGNLNQVILGYLYLLKNAKDEQTRKKNVEGIKKSIMKSKRLAESIRILKIIKDTKIEKFNLNKSIERSIRDIKEYSDREIEVNLNIDKKYYVKANDFLDKVFFNILENSVEYTFHDPVIIDIEIEEKDDFCNIHIRDNGIGIPKEKREDILRNLETLSKRTGIGLYLTKKILDRFDGKFEIKDVEKGTEIVISIPVIS